MLTMNKVLLAGNLTRNPELRETQNGTPVGSFGLAMNERYRTRDGEDREDVCFVDVEVWGRQAETCDQYLEKGAPAFIEGRLRLNQWEDRESGEQRSRIMVKADRVQFLSTLNRDSGNGGESEGTGRRRSRKTGGRSARRAG